MISFSTLSPAAQVALCTPIHSVLPAHPGLHLGALYIGSLQAALDPALLAAHHIDAVVRVMPDGPLIIDDARTPTDVLAIEIPDSTMVDLRPHLVGAVRFIDERRRHGQNVLVHCQHGISRSASIVLAYLIRALGVSYSTAITFLRSKRACVKPNAGFVAALQEWSRQRPVPTSPVRPVRPPLRRSTANLCLSRFKLHRACAPAVRAW
ncbi:hypothetical protein CERSUDRAFT_126495 [Gelatoporia subvermispora B]|uniref:protein-tyrosine-phosphatase n=1 Tax=Ceriporiopsis subvermispora (strain B) TaxID=914234 RepID=M2QLK1_CERS8|nr:hypothetical protein CERSUDRAFT_126495 [Gelatoporia subvermispora B]